MTGVSLGPVVHSDTGHDADCDPVFVFHDAAQHRFSAPPSIPDELPSGEHCVVCHLFRHSRGSEAAALYTTSDLEAQNVLRWADDGLLPALATVRLPARAPPVHA
jgi:hypothetical protein